MPICAICGKVVEKVTSDHIPPKSMFGTKPNNLITVPACPACNGGSSADDEYFRLIASEVDTAVHPDANASEKSVAHGSPPIFRVNLQPVNVTLPAIEDADDYAWLLLNRVPATSSPQRAKPNCRSHEFQRVGKGQTNRAVGSPTQGRRRAISAAMFRRAGSSSWVKR